MDHTIEYVVMDIGSSGEPPKIFESIREKVFLIGFEPDSREQDQSFGKRYKNSLVVPKIVVPEQNIDKARFFLTQSPYCSSTLEPDLKALENYSFKSLFNTVKTVDLPAVSLNRLMTEIEVNHLDWLKVDAQGADLKLIKSFSDSLLEKIIVLETEPGFIDAYKGEDLFPAVHTYLMARDFWLADLQTQSYPRISEDCLAKASRDFGSEFQARSLKSSPTAAEAKYFRTREYYSRTTLRNCLVGFRFALLTGFLGFATEIYYIARKRFPQDDSVQLMETEIKAHLKNNLQTSAIERVADPSGVSLLSWIKSKTPYSVKVVINFFRRIFK